MAASPPDDDLYEAIREQYPPVLTTAQVGELLHIGPRTVLAMASDGRLKASRLPGTRQYNFFREDVIRVLDQNMVSPGEMDLDAVEEPVVEAAPKKKSGVRRRRG
ncbi:MAG TPA: helix-turn-helix domain-containing protein [Acidimicrobiales bacterium]|nr:helix-turn-helix domain-containing protein [Acidimicrobiales bacterium]